jgi:hypothetical protein
MLEREMKQIALHLFFKKEQYFRTDSLALATATGTRRVRLKARVFI